MSTSSKDKTQASGNRAMQLTRNNVKEKTFIYDGKKYSIDEVRSILDNSEARCATKGNRINITAQMVNGKNNRVLEVGCGAGYTAKVLDSKTSEFIGIDLIEGYVDIAKEFYGSKKNRFFVADIEKDGSLLKKNYFDYVLLLEVIEHTDNPGKLVSRCMEFLKKGGRLIVSTPNAVSITNILWNIKMRNFIRKSYALDGTESDHVCLWDRQTLQNMLVRNNLKIIELSNSKATITQGQSLIACGQK